MKIIYYIIISILFVPLMVVANENKGKDKVSQLIGEAANKSENDKPSINKYWKLGSIMFDEKKIDWVEKAIKSNETGVPLSKLIPEIFKPEIVEVPVENKTIRGQEVKIITTPQTPDIPRPDKAPAFYLSSILYIAPDNWSVWINGEKVSYGENYEDVEIVKVTESDVTMIWRDTQIDYISPDWDRKFRVMSDKRFVSNNKNIVVDLENGDISFVLGINQSFDTSEMGIVEGVAYSKDLSVSANSNNMNQDMKAYEPDTRNPKMRGGAGSKNNDNSALYNSNPDLEFTGDYIKQLETLRSMLGK
jgi:hypothetical protein